MGTRAWRVGSAMVVAVVAGLVACSQDFGPTGGSLPLDVDQDSLAVVLDPPLSPEQAESVEPMLSEAVEDREVLLLGSHESGAWRASPLIRFDFSDIPDTLDLAVSNWSKVELILQQFKADNDNVEINILRDVEVLELADTLRVDDANAPLASVLGSSLRAFTSDDIPDFLAGTRYLLTLASPVQATDPVVQAVDAWIQARDHKGIAVVETGFTFAPSDTGITEVDESIVRFASDNLSESNFSFLADLNIESIPYPLLKITFKDDPDNPLLLPSRFDLTNLERAEPATVTLRLSSFDARRMWLQFDLPGEAVPGNATVNRAELVLVPDPSRSVTVGSRVASAYQATLAQAAAADRGGADFVSGSSTGFILGLDEELRMDVTELVQRAVNGLVAADEGILISFGDEVFDVSFLEFYGPDAADPDQRPRLEITFTPPADFVE